MWRYITARTTGTRHIEADLPCQDRLSCSVHRSEILAAIVADGAGSAKMAHRGAEIAVEASGAVLAQAILAERTDYDNVLRQAFSKARDMILAEAKSTDEDPRAFASTLLIALVGPQGGAALQIGDGVIVVGDGGNEWCWVFWPQHGEHINTTYFVTDQNASDHVQVEKFPGNITDLAMMSDGLESVALHLSTKTVYQPFFNGLFSPIFNSETESKIIQLSLALEQFLLSERIRSRTDDDISLILATRRKHDHSR